MQGNSDHLARRVREIRRALFGDHGISTLSQAVDIPERTWDNFENGVTIPAWIIWQFSLNPISHHLSGYSASANFASTGSSLT
jgi:hypothetical protein